jgi:hypothetical protein
MITLKHRIDSLNSESQRLRTIIDERYTARLLLGLSQGKDQDEKAPKSSAMLCSDSFCEASELFKEEGQTLPQKRVRRHGKYTQQERDIFRRERNRMHAKKTRDRKKKFFELSEKIIVNMENEAKILRYYLLSINVLTAEQVALSEKTDQQFRISLAKIKNEAAQDNSDDEEEEDDDEEDAEQEGREEYEELNSEENDQAENDSNNEGSWNGSNDGSNVEGSNGSSSNGETSRESGSNNSGTNSTDGSIKQDLKDNESDNNGSKSPIDEDMQYQDNDLNSYDSALVNKSSLDAHNSKHNYLQSGRLGVRGI